MSLQTRSTGTFKRAFSELETARDTAKVRAHLLTLDARERWRELESSAEALEQKLEREGEKAGALALATVAELTHSLKEFIQHKLPGGGKLDAPVNSIMTRDVRTCSPDDSLNVPAQIMWEANCGGVPVLADGRALGMITDRDICIASYMQGQPQTASTVASAMSKHLYTCQENDPVVRVLQVMKAEQVHRVLVTDSEGKLLGIVALADIARQLGSVDDVALAVAIARAVERLSELRSDPEGERS